MIDLQKALIGYVSALAIAGSAVLAFNYVTPTAHWFSYEGVEYVGTEGQSLVFRSTLKRRRPADMVFQDTLFCQHIDGKFGIYSTQKTHFYGAPVREMKATDWNYTADYPKGRKCYLRSLIGAELLAFYLKTTTTETPIFTTPE